MQPVWAQGLLRLPHRLAYSSNARNEQQMPRAPAQDNTGVRTLQDATDAPPAGFLSRLVTS